MKLLNPIYRAQEGRDRERAETGASYAMFNLGLTLERLGNDTEAKTWYWKAAEAGDADALDNLLRLLERTGHNTAAEHATKAATKAALAVLQPLCAA